MMTYHRRRCVYDAPGVRRSDPISTGKFKIACSEVLCMISVPHACNWVPAGGTGHRPVANGACPGQPEGAWPRTDRHVCVCVHTYNVVG